MKVNHFFLKMEIVILEKAIRTQSNSRKASRQVARTTELN